tara:strand:- start:540 stop:1199 length:660 start_codon:yes stop_codon:yes gene_type:complete
MIDISIIIINHNRENFLERSLRSCVDQIVFNKKFEIIFVDDGSTDNSYKIAQKFLSNISAYKLKKNMGISYASNFALSKSKGEFFIRVDSDDFINKNTINYLHDIMINNKDLAFTYCDHYKVDEFGYKEKIVKLKSKKLLKNHGAGVMFNKKKFIKYGAYNLELQEAEDYEIISKILKKEKVFYLPIPLYRYYNHNKNISNSGLRNSIIKKINKKLSSV